jgi:class 3 adenylate cyclase/tetratricopeptide (TPR) repeat protein
VAAERCPRCGRPLPAGANFCPNCGAPVSVPEASERRLVTVVFVDMAGSTELAAQLDAERFREILAAFHGMVTEEAAWLGGVAEGFIGDAVLVVFGIPAARDDDAIRAIRAAIEIRDRAAELGAPLGLSAPLRVRIGIRSGQVAVGTARDRNIVIGAEVNLGARLQQAAAPGEILVGDTTMQLARDGVVFGERRTIEAKGFDGAVAAWPVEGLIARPVDRRHIAFVDRRRELGLLTDLFDRAASRERAHLVTLLGEPGIGKTRVVDEFVASLPGSTQVLTGRSSPFEEEVELWPLAQMVHRQLGDDPEAPAADLEDRLREAVAGWVDADEVETAARRLGLAIGLRADGDGEETRYELAEVRQGVLTMLVGLARSSPVVLVFEDLHQADPLLLDLIEQLLKEARTVPLLVICVARWDFLETRPSWAGGLPDAVTLWVEELEPDHAARLAMEAGGLERGDAERVAAHAGGNPLFIIEITGMLAREEETVPPVGPAVTGLVLPTTVQAVIAARIDQISPPARALVRRASVFPRGRFDTDELSLIADPVPGLLEEAEDDELLLPDEEHEGVWRFRSDVIRDVAYDSLAKRERRRLHLRVADKLSEPDVVDRYPRTIAFHLEQAARASLDLDPNDRALTDRAVEALTRAGDAARRRIESRAAVDLYERALALAGPESGWGVREAWIVGMLGEARYWLGDFDEAEARFRKAMSLGAGDDRVIAHAARFLADITLTIRGDDSLAVGLFERSLDAARRLGDPRVLSRTLLMAGWVPYWRNDLDDADAMFREALDVARSQEGTDAWAEVRALVGLAGVTSPRGNEADVLAIANEALKIAEASGQQFSAAIAHQLVSASSLRMLDLEAALDHADTAVRVLRELGARWELASVLGDRGSTHRVAGRLDEAEADLREAFVLCQDLKERALVTWTASELARTLAMRGDVAGARGVLADPLARTAEGQPGGTVTLLYAEAVTDLAEGDRPSARTRSIAILEGAAAQPALANRLAAARWWVGSLFGPEAAGGQPAVDEARDALHRNGWLQALREPELAAALGPASASLQRP